jgi:hypothetical protein
MTYYITDYIRDKTHLQSSKMARLLTITILLVITVLLNTVINSNFLHALGFILVLLFFLAACLSDDEDDDSDSDDEPETDLPSDHSD